MGQQRADIVGKPRHQLQRIRLIRRHRRQDEGWRKEIVIRIGSDVRVGKDAGQTSVRAPSEGDYGATKRNAKLCLVLRIAVPNGDRQRLGKHVLVCGQLGRSCRIGRLRGATPKEVVHAVYKFLQLVGVVRSAAVDGQ